MYYQQLQDLAILHVAELRQIGVARRPAVGSKPTRVARRRAPARRPPTLRARAGWTLVTIGLSLAARPPANRRLPAG